MTCNGCQQNTSSPSRIDMLTSYDWLDDLPDSSHLSDIVEVRFKGTHKDFFKNKNMLQLKRGDIVVLGSKGGHNIGYVSMTGKLAKLQYDRKVKNKERHEWFPVYRVASEHDKEKWQEALKREKSVMIRARQIAEELNLDMKIGDVEFRGDGGKAIFYYLAEGRVDFRELIKVYAREFQIRIEMKQIGARQEAARIGGFGSCGRELCCSSWRTDFSSITSGMAHKQGLSPNAEKLTGRCGKLKCCLMYELDTYLEAQKDFPSELLALETAIGYANHINTDILKKKITYMVVGKRERHTFTLDLDQVKDVIQKNKRGIKPEMAELLTEKLDKPEDEKNMFNQNMLTGDIQRHMNPTNKRKSNNNNRNRNRNVNKKRNDLPKKS